MQRTKIEWTEFSWNPIRGICPVDCKLPDGKSYCYGRTIYNRFDWLQEGIGDIGYLAEWELDQPIKRKKPAKIFACSTYELFHLPNKSARDEIFKVIEACPQHTFQILTKFPQNIDRPMPDNVWLGVSVTRENDSWRLWYLKRYQGVKIKFVSYEPLLDEVIFLDEWLDWVVVGRLTGHGKKHNPRKEQLETIIKRAKKWNIPIFLKNNLKEIFGEPLIQEFPE